MADIHDSSRSLWLDLADQFFGDWRFVFSACALLDSWTR